MTLLIIGEYRSRLGRLPLIPYEANESDIFGLSPVGQVGFNSLSPSCTILLSIVERLLPLVSLVITVPTLMFLGLLLPSNIDIPSSSPLIQTFKPELFFQQIVPPDAF